MAMAKPVVATSISIEGLEVSANEEVLIADNARDFARKVVYLLKNPDDARRLGQRGYEHVRKTYSWKGMEVSSRLATLVTTYLEQTTDTKLKVAAFWAMRSQWDKAREILDGINVDDLKDSQALADGLRVLLADRPW